MNIFLRGLFVLFLLFPPARVSADGMMVRADLFGAGAEGSWDLHEETAQEALLALSGGRQKMLLRVGLEAAGNKSVFWILPVPSPADQVNIDLPLDFPHLEGEDVVKKLQDQALLIGTAARHLQFQATATSYLDSISGKLFLGLPTMSLGELVGDQTARSPDVVVAKQIEKDGMTAQALTARTPEALLAYLRGKGLRVREGALPTLAAYIGKNYSFVVSWISAGSRPIKRQERAIYLSFPTEKLFYPLVPTSVYGDKIVPATLRVIGQATPDLPAKLEPFAVVRYYFGNGHVAVDVSRGEGFYTSAPLEYTKIELRAPSKALTEDLWISLKSPPHIRAAFLLARRPWIITFLVYAAGVLAGFFAGWACFKSLRNRLGGFKLLFLALLSALCNPFLALAAAVWKFDGEPVFFSRRTLVYIPLCGLGLAAALWLLALATGQVHSPAFPALDLSSHKVFSYAVLLWWGSFLAYFIARALALGARRRILFCAAALNIVPLLMLMGANLAADNSNRDFALPWLMELASPHRRGIWLAIAVCLGLLGWSRSGLEAVYPILTKAGWKWLIAAADSLRLWGRERIPVTYRLLFALVILVFGLIYIPLTKDIFLPIIGWSFQTGFVALFALIFALPLLGVASIELGEEHAWLKVAALGLLWGLWLAMPMPFQPVEFVDGEPAANVLVPLLGALLGLCSMAVRTYFRPGTLPRLRPNLVLAAGLAIPLIGLQAVIFSKTPKPDWSVAALRSSLVSSDPSVGYLAAKCLEIKYSDPDERAGIVNGLITSLNDPSREQRYSTIELFGWLTPVTRQAATVMVWVALHGENREVKFRARVAIVRWLLKDYQLRDSIPTDPLLLKKKAESILGSVNVKLLVEGVGADVYRNHDVRLLILLGRTEKTIPAPRNAY